MLTREKLIALLNFSASMIAIGLSVVISDQIVSHFPVFFGVAAIFFFSLLLMGPLILIFPQWRTPISRHDWKMIFVQAIVGAVFFRISFFFGVKLLHALDTGIISSITPLVVALLGYTFFKEKLSRNEIIGVFLSVCGIFILNYEKILAVDVVSLLGLLLILLSVLFDSVFIVAGSKISKNIHPIYKSILVMGITFIVFLPFALYDAMHMPTLVLPFRIWAPILEYGLIANPIIYVCLYLGGTKLSSATTGVLASLIPISAVLGSVFFLGAHLTGFHLAGMICVLSAILVASLRSK